MGAVGRAVRTILVVDDDADIQETLRLVLEDEGFVVLLAGNGREALDILEGGLRPCVVLVDLMMPIMNGWELIDRIRHSATLSQLTVVVVSAAGESLAVPEGVRETLRKPVRLDRLIEVVSVACP